MHRSLLASIVLATLAVACGAPEEEATTKRTKTSKDATDPTQQFGGTNPDGTPAKQCVKDPSFYDVLGDDCDNDGDGTVDNSPSCDDAATNGTAAEFARAIGICGDASKLGFGLVSAAFTQGNGRTDAPNPEQHGVLTKFGNVLKPREGSKLGVLSTGYAQEFNGGQAAFSPGVAWDSNSVTKGAAPPGYPKPTAGCPQDKRVRDVISLKLQLTAPKNVAGIKFDFNFHSSEWPTYICSAFNDGFVAWLSAKGFNGGAADNISYDSNGNPVSVNNGFFDRCTPNTTTGCAGTFRKKSACGAGTSELAGTGFGIEGAGCGKNEIATKGGATGWLTSQAAVLPGETFTLELMIWDVGDGSLDSSVLIDNFQWIAGDIATATERPADVK